MVPAEVSVVEPVTTRVPSLRSRGPVPALTVSRELRFPPLSTVMLAPARETESPSMSVAPATSITLPPEEVMLPPARMVVVTRSSWVATS